MIFTHRGQDKMANILQMTFWSALSYWKCLNFDQNSTELPCLGSNLQHVFRLWFGTEEATSHYLNHWWLSLLMHISLNRPQWVETNDIYYFPMDLGCQLSWGLWWIYNPIGYYLGCYPGTLSSLSSNCKDPLHVDDLVVPNLHLNCINWT